MSLIRTIIVLLLSGIAAAAPPINSPRIPSPIEPSSNRSLFTTLRQPSTNLSVPNVNCNGDQYRRDLEYKSCIDALFQIPNDGQQLRFASRDSTLEYDLPLPRRWISGDGICLIDILKGTAFPVGTASFNDLYDAAYWIIHECVMDEEVGGLAINIGPQQSMAIRVTSYRPLVRCSDEQTTSPAPEACHTIVDRMPAQRPPGAQGKMTFGQPGDPDVQVGLPYRITEPTGQCQAVIAIVRGLSDKAIWYEIWEGVVAVVGMCVRYGRSGLAFHRGTWGYLTVTVSSGGGPGGAISEA